MNVAGGRLQWSHGLLVLIVRLAGHSRPFAGEGHIEETCSAWERRLLGQI